MHRLPEHEESLSEWLEVGAGNYVLLSEAVSEQVADHRFQTGDGVQHPLWHGRTRNPRWACGTTSMSFVVVTHATTTISLATPHIPKPRHRFRGS